MHGGDAGAGAPRGDGARATGSQPCGILGFRVRVCPRRQGKSFNPDGKKRRVGGRTSHTKGPGLPIGFIAPGTSGRVPAVGVLVGSDVTHGPFAPEGRGIGSAAYRL